MIFKLGISLNVNNNVTQESKGNLCRRSEITLTLFCVLSKEICVFDIVHMSDNAKFLGLEGI